MKYKLLFLLSIISLLFSGLSYGQSSLSMQTYYTSPFGSYLKITLKPRAQLDNSACIADTVGLMYVEKPATEQKSIPHFCRNISGTATWDIPDEIWKPKDISATDIYLKDYSSAEVGIGITSPQSKLHVSGAAGPVDLFIEADTDATQGNDQPSLRILTGSSTGLLGFFDGTDAGKRFDFVLKNLNATPMLNCCTFSLSENFHTLIPECIGSQFPRLTLLSLYVTIRVC